MSHREMCDFGCFPIFGPKRQHPEGLHSSSWAAQKLHTFPQNERHEQSDFAAFKHRTRHERHEQSDFAAFKHNYLTNMTRKPAPNPK